MLIETDSARSPPNSNVVPLRCAQLVSRSLAWLNCSWSIRLNPSRLAASPRPAVRPIHGQPAHEPSMRPGRKTSERRCHIVMRNVPFRHLPPWEQACSQGTVRGRYGNQEPAFGLLTSRSKHIPPPRSDFSLSLIIELVGLRRLGRLLLFPRSRACNGLTPI